MFIDQFLRQHPQIKISPQVLEVCQAGEQLMAASHDPLHNHFHLERLLKNLARFLRHHPQHQPDYQVLLMAICWHDVWKAARQTYNPFKLIYYQIYEGWGSFHLFHHHNHHRLSPTVLAATLYAIRKHSQFQLLSLKTLEAKILRDIDDLDILSKHRLEPLIKRRHQFHHLTKLFGKWALRLLASDLSVKAAQFPWTKRKISQQNRIVNKFLKWI